MTRNLRRRLEKLEDGRNKVRAREKYRAEPPDHSGADVIREFLRVNNIVPLPEESLSTTFARALGISNRELRRLLWARAYGSRPLPKGW